MRGWDGAAVSTGQNINKWLLIRFSGACCATTRRAPCFMQLPMLTTHSIGRRCVATIRVGLLPLIVSNYKLSFRWALSITITLQTIVNQQWPLSAYWMLIDFLEINIANGGQILMTFKEAVKAKWCLLLQRFSAMVWWSWMAGRCLGKCPKSPGKTA